MPKKFLALAVASLVAGLGLAACDSGGSDELVIYSGRSENLVQPILDRFEEEEGVKISVRYGDTAELAAALLEEGDNTKADVFFSQDAGALAAVASRDLLADLPAAATAVVDDRFKDPGGRWVGITGRARVVAYNTDELTEADLPDDIFELTDPKWKDRVGLPPTNASFIAFVSALTEEHGVDRTRAFLEGL